MSSAKHFSHKNIERARHWLPFINPSMRDLITLLPSLFCEGRQSVGIYSHITCSHKEYELLSTYLDRKPLITPGRLPDRMPIESLIVVPRPSLSSRFNARIIVMCKTKTQSVNEEVYEKAHEISRVFHKSGISVSFIVYSGTLPELIVYDIIRTGLVLGGKHPVTKEHLESDHCTYIGDLPGIITDISRFEYDEWNPFQAFLDQEIDLFIKNSDYPAPLVIVGANPFIIPYLHILHQYDENMIAESIKKIRTSLSLLFSSFPPTREAINDMKRVWKMADSYHISDGKGFANALHLRKWLVPLEENELPVFTWPPPEHMSLESVQLCLNNDLWQLKEAAEFQCRHAWAVLMWGFISGIITLSTRITTPRTLNLRSDAKKRLYAAYKTLEQDTHIIVPEDHMQGSIQKMNGRFYFSDKPFAILEQGNKHSLEIFETIKKKALLDDIDL